MATNSDVSAISSSMRVMEIITLVPDAAGIMTEYGLHCFSCSLGGVETLAEGVSMHGMDDDTLNALLVDLNEAFDAQPEREQIVTVSTDAAEAIAAIAKEQDRVGDVLRIVPDMHGGFCLEFFTEPESGDAIFTADGIDDVRVCVSPIILRRIGGAVIDKRNDRLALDLPDDVVPGQCCGGKEACTSCD